MGAAALRGDTVPIVDLTSSVVIAITRVTTLLFRMRRRAVRPGLVSHTSCHVVNSPFENVSIKSELCRRPSIHPGRHIILPIVLLRYAVLADSPFSLLLSFDIWRVCVFFRFSPWIIEFIPAHSKERRVIIFDAKEL